MSVIFNEIGGYPTGGLLTRSYGMGNVLYVSSIYGKDNNPGSAQAPLASISKALANLNKANNPQNRGDTILCLPGHIETVANSTGLVVARTFVTIEGVGDGEDRPAITLSANTAASVNISNASVYLRNLRIVSNIVSVSSMITVGAKNLVLDNVRVEEGTGDYVNAITYSSTTANLCDGLSIINGSQILGVSSNTVAGLSVSGNTDRLQVVQSYIELGNSSSNLIKNTSATTALLTRAAIKLNDFSTTGTANGCVLNILGAGHTGLVSECGIGDSIANHTTTLPMVASGFRYKENYASGQANTSGVLSPPAGI